MRNFVLSLFIVMTITFLNACTGIPEGVEPIKNFNAQQYLGTWYEIARLDHSFERDMTHVSAQYVLKDNGDIQVLNQGFSNKIDACKQAEGNAKIIGDENIGHLKVSFFGPFYGSYIVFNWDRQQGVAYVAGNNHNYLWMLSRTPTVPESVMSDFKQQAQNRGFDISQLIIVEQDPAKLAIEVNKGEAPCT